MQEGMSTPFARVLAALAARNATGRLTVTAGEAVRELYLKTGELVQASSRLSEEALGAVLLRSGMLDVEDLAPALEQAAAEGRQLGDVLIAAGRLSPMDVVEALERQVRLRATNCLRLETFDHRFDEGAQPPVQFQVRIPVPAFLYEAVGEAMPVGRMRETLGLTGESRVKLALDPDEALEGLGAGPKAARQVRRMPSASIGEIVAESEDGGEAIVRLVYVLWALGRLELDGAPVSPRAPPPAEPKTPPPDPAQAERSPEERSQLRERLLDQLHRGGASVAAGASGKDPASKTDVARQVVLAWLRMDRLDYFALLGLRRDAAPSDVRIAYGGMLRRLHLDAPPEDWPDQAKEAAEALLRKASLAFAVLTDAGERRAYLGHLKAAAQKPYVPDPMIVSGMTVRRAERLLGAGRYAEAAAQLRHVLEEAPKDPALHLALGRTLYEWTVKKGEDQADEAASALAEAARLDPAHDAPWLYLGLLARHRGDDAHARKMLGKALTVNPRNARAQTEMEAVGAKSGLFGKLFGK
jgi:tetratricopeptide (TPR) repeat protein